MNPQSRSNRVLNPALAGVFAAYAAGLLLLAIYPPLRLDETLQLAAVKDHSLPELLTAVAASPGAGPLHYILQLPFIALFGVGRLAVRFLSLIWALGAAFAFWHLARLLNAAKPLLCLCLFLLLPSHLMFATAGRPFEQALFFLLLALIFFFRVALKPSVKLAAAYALAVLATIYTEPFAVLPAAGCLLFHLRGVADKPNRRAFWFLLPATALPALLYLPFAIWAVPQNYAVWLTTGAPSGSLTEQALQSLTGTGSLAEALSVVLLLAALVVAYQALRPVPLPNSAPRTTNNLFAFCCFGALLVTVFVVLALDAAQRSPVWPAHLLFLAPVLVILFDAATRYIRVPSLASLAFAVPLLIAALTLTGTLRQPSFFDPQAEAKALRSTLTPDSCVVFVSEGVSKWLFLPFEPSLEASECKDFFHRRIVLAVHPFVRPDQLEDARTFFLGLNLREVSNVPAGGGHIITLRADQ